MTKWSVRLGVPMLLLAIFVYLHDIDKSINSQNRPYLKYYLQGVPYIHQDIDHLCYAEQLEVIMQVQQNVVDIAPKKNGIPQGKDRNLRSLYNQQGGLCYDRSFNIEIILQHLGFETRHLSLYQNPAAKSTLTVLSSRGIVSHATTEVKTKEGWLLVDPDTNWLGIDKDMKPVDFKHSHRVETIDWCTAPPYNIYEQSITVVYGLYSRHGKFFPPYNAIPDYKLSELIYNL